MSVTQKLILIKLHKILVANNLFYAANNVLQILIQNKIPNTVLELSILRVHLLSVFSVHLVEIHFPHNSIIIKKAV